MISDHPFIRETKPPPDYTTLVINKLVHFGIKLLTNWGNSPICCPNPQHIPPFSAPNTFGSEHVIITEGTVQSYFTEYILGNLREIISVVLSLSGMVAARQLAYMYSLVVWWHNWDPWPQAAISYDRSVVFSNINPFMGVLLSILMQQSQTFCTLTHGQTVSWEGNLTLIRANCFSSWCSFKLCTQANLLSMGFLHSTA